MSPPSLRHADPSRPDDRLSADAAGHLSRYPALQLVAELYTRLREMAFPWWTPEQLREAFPAVQRLGWFNERADLRQRITTQLTGLAPRAARNKTADFQASLIDSVIDEADITVESFESAFEPADLAVYAPAAEVFRLFRRRMPWDDDSTPHQDLVGWLIGALLADKSALDGSARMPVLSAVQVRTAIDGRVWHSRIPLHVRVAIDDARFAAQRERPHEPYGVERDLAIATPALIAASIPLRDLLGVIDVATQALGFDDGSSPPRAYAREQATRSTAPRAPDGDESGPRVPPLPKEEEHDDEAERALAAAFAAAPVAPPTPAVSVPVIVPQKSASRSVPPPSRSTPPPAMRSTPPPATRSAPPPAMRSAPPPPPPPDDDDDPLESGPATAQVAPTTRGSRTNKTDDMPEIELHSQHETEPPQFADEQTSGGGSRESITDELEHTNPWVVPQLSGELAQIAKEIAKEIREAREKKKNEGEG